VIDAVVHRACAACGVETFGIEGTRGNDVDCATDTAFLQVGGSCLVYFGGADQLSMAARQMLFSVMQHDWQWAGSS
jgi:hypothetical protein